KMSESEGGETFFHKSVAQRVAVVAAGPIANFLLASVMFAGVAMVYGKQETAARVDEVIPQSAAAAAGFQPGDLVVSIDGAPIESFADMQRIVSTNAGRSLNFGIERNGSPLTLSLVPRLHEDKGGFAGTREIRVLGVKRSLPTGDVKHHRVVPIAPTWLWLSDTW